MIYSFQEIEEKQRKKALKERYYKIERDRLKPRLFLFIDYINTKSYGLNISDAKPYVYLDFIARYERLVGKNVLFSLGYNNINSLLIDAATNMNKPLYSFFTDGYKVYQRDFRMLELSFDAEKEIAMNSIDYITYIQKVFKEFYTKGLISIENTYQAISDKKIYQKYEYTIEDNQFFDNEHKLINQVKKNVLTLNFSSIEKELLSSIETLDVSSDIKNDILKMLGYECGLKVFFRLSNEDYIKIKVLKPEYICGISYICLNPKRMSVNNYIDTSEVDFNINIEKKFFYSGIDAYNPIDGNKIPLFISDLYDEDIHLGIPSVSDFDENIAFRYDLPFNPIFDFFGGKKILVNSSYLNGYTSEEANTEVSRRLLDLSLATTYERLNNLSFIISTPTRFGIPVPLSNDYQLFNIPILYDLKHDVKISKDEVCDKFVIREFFNDQFVKALLVNAIRLKTENEILDIHDFDVSENISRFKNIDISIIKDKNASEDILWNLVLAILSEKYIDKNFGFQYNNILLSKPVYGKDDLHIKRENNNIVPISEFINQNGSTILRFYYAYNGNVTDIHHYNPLDIEKINDEIESIIKIFYYPIDDKCFDLDFSYQQMLTEASLSAEKYDFKKYLEAIIRFSKKAHEIKHISRAQAKGFLILLSVITPALASQIAEDVLNLRNPLFFYNFPE